LRNSVVNCIEQGNIVHWQENVAYYILLQSFIVISHKQGINTIRIVYVAILLK